MRRGPGSRARFTMSPPIRMTMSLTRRHSSRPPLAHRRELTANSRAGWQMCRSPLPKSTSTTVALEMADHKVRNAAARQIVHHHHTAPMRPGTSSSVGKHPCSPRNTPTVLSSSLVTTMSGCRRCSSRRPSRRSRRRSPPGFEEPETCRRHCPATHSPPNPCSWR